MIDILSELIKLMEMKDKAQVNALIDEMVVFQREYSKIQSIQVSPQLVVIDCFAGSSIKTSSPDLGQDMWKQLSRVNIPVGVKATMTVGKLLSLPALTKHQPQRNINCYNFVKTLLGMHLRQYEE